MGGGLVVLLVIAALVVILVWLLMRGKAPHFIVLVDGEPIQEAPIALRSGHEMYLNDIASVFSLAKQRNAKSVAKLSVTDGKVPLTILKQDRFPKVTENPEDTLGRTIAFKAESGKSVTLKVQLADAGPSSASAKPAADEQEKTPATSPAPRRRAASKTAPKAAKRVAPSRKVPSKERKK